MTSLSTAAYFQSEAAYWRARAEKLEKTLRGMTRDAARTVVDLRLPPEPPASAEVHVHGAPQWIRIASGWYCTRPECLNCPTDWQEVWERSASADGAVIVLPAEEKTR